MSAMPSTVRRPGTLTSSNSTPRRRSSATTGDVVDLERDLRVVARSTAGRLEHGEVAVATAVAKTALACLDWFQAELLGVEGTGPLEVLRREAGRDFSVLERRHARYDLPRRRSSSGTGEVYPDASNRSCRNARTCSSAARVG